MKRSILDNLKKAAYMSRFTRNLPLVTAISAFVTFAALPHSAYASDTWGFCVIVDHHGHRARFTNIFHYPFMVTKFELKPSAERFKSDTGSEFRAAPDCQVFNDEASAIKQRNSNIELMHRFGAEAYVMDYNVKYKNYPSTPLPKPASNPESQPAQNTEQSASEPSVVKQQPRVTAQNKNRDQLPSNSNSSHQPSTQMKPHTRLSTQEAIAQAQQKTHRLKLAEEKRERQKAERERQQHEREKRAREKAERERIVHNVVLTWQNKAGKWFACGPVQCIWDPEDTERQALDYVLGKPRHTIVGSSRYYGCHQYTVAAKAKDTAGDASEASIRRRATCRIGKIGDN